MALGVDGKAKDSSSPSSPAAAMSQQALLGEPHQHYCNVLRYKPAFLWHAVLPWDTA